MAGSKSRRWRSRATSAQRIAEGGGRSRERSFDFVSGPSDAGPRSCPLLVRAADLILSRFLARWRAPPFFTSSASLGLPGPTSAARNKGTTSRSTPHANSYRNGTGRNELETTSVGPCTRRIQPFNCSSFDTVADKATSFVFSDEDMTDSSQTVPRDGSFM